MIAIRKFIRNMLGVQDAPVLVQPQKTELVRNVWLKHVVSPEEVAEHNAAGYETEKLWTKIPAGCEVWYYDSGFCTGHALVKNGEVIDDIHEMFYRRAR